MKQGLSLKRPSAAGKEGSRKQLYQTSECCGQNFILFEEVVFPETCEDPVETLSFFHSNLKLQPETFGSLGDKIGWQVLIIIAPENFKNTNRELEILFYI